MSLLARFLKIATVASAALLAACGGGGGGGGIGPIFGGGNGSNPYQCSTGTQVTLANPQPGQYNVPANVGAVTIVANGNNNYLYQSYNSWQVVLFDNYGNTIPGGNLTLVSDQNGPHPYSSDYYYNSSFQNLPTGVTWNAYLEQNGAANCPLGSFST